ncbi:MAG: T9SS type A sorting domain-containing protein [Sphingobacteriaceae bacterium]|nr:T9SS type A sorting domain-containing protein [Sphingobacteriaceae bacterium]
MTKRLSLLIVSVLWAVAAYAQPTNLPAGVSARFFTSFENPNPFDSTTSVGVPGWQSNTTYQFPVGSGGRSVVGRFDPSQGNTLTTAPFSTLGQFKVWLDFAHICKIELNDSAVVQISVDGGITWQPLTGQNCLYLGGSADFRNSGRFSHFSYPADWAPATLLTIPTATWWKQERFDITNIASNQADVRIRFRMRDNNNNGMGNPLPGGFGWILDSVLVTSAFSEIIPPIITHTPLTGLQFNIGQNISATVRDSFGCDSSGVLDAWVFYKINGGALDSAQMVRQGTTLTWSFNLDTSRVVDGDTVQYYLRARDSSPRQNIRYFPNMATPGATFITYFASIFPTIANHTPIVGQQFSAGPFVFSANISDASGIDSAILHYRFNNGPWQLRRMPLISGILYRDTLRPLDGDTVDYYIEAVDNSIRRFRRAIPDTATSWRFIASGKPTVTWPNSSAQCDVFLGALFELGPFNIGVKAEDGSGIDTVMLYYRVNSGAFDSVGMVRNTVAGAFCNWIGTIPAVSDSDTVAYYVRAIDASSRRNFRIDPDNGQFRQFVALAGIRFPYVDGFDASDAWRSFIASGTNLNNPVTVPGGWVRGTPAKSILNSARSAPNAWMPGPLNANYDNNAWFILETPVFDFATAQNATLSFWQWRDINNGGASTSPGIPGNGDGFWIEYTTQVNATAPVWNRLGNANAADTNQSGWYNRSNINGLAGALGGAWDGQSNGWERSVRRLIEPAFQGANGAGRIRFRFVFRSNATIQANGVAIDDFSIVLPKQRDLAVTTIASNAQSTPIQPSNNNFQVIAGDPVVVFARLRNFGLAVLDTIVPIVVEVGSYRDTTFLNTGAIQPNAFTFNSLRLDTIPAAPARWFTVKVYSILPGDEDRLNDTLEIQMYGVPQLNVPHSDNFDGVDNWLPLATGTNPIVWERGAPTGTQLSAPASAPNVWATGLTGNPASNISGYLLSPLFNFNNSVNTTLRFKMNRRMLPGAGVRISFADGLFTNWQVLGTVNDAAGINWYNAPTASIVGVTAAAWTGLSPAFIQHTLELPPAFNYRAGRGVRFRFDFQNNPTGGGEGVIIDDWEILPPPPREIGLLGFVGPVACPDSVRAIDTIRVIIRNFGGDTLYSVPFNYTFNNGPLQLANDFIYNDTIPPAATRIVTILPGFISPQPAANYDLRVFARLSNDARRANDTIMRCIKTIPPIDLLMVRAISPPNSICFPSGPREVKFLIRNIGNSASSTFTAGYRLDSLPAVTQTVNLVIPPNGFDTITMTVPVNIPNGTSRLRMFVNASADPVRNNDTLSVQITGRTPITLTHIDDFERNTPLQYCLFSGINARLEIRDNLVPFSNNPSGKVLFMGSFAAGTSFNVNIPTNPWVDTWNGPWLSTVAFPVETSNRDSIRIRFRLLQIAGSNNPGDRISLFRVVANGRQIGATLQPIAATPANHPYVQYDLRLDTVYNAGEPLLIEFQSKTRYTLSTTGAQRNGNLVDDVIIYNAMPNGAEVMEVSYTPPFPSANTPVTALARIRNNGTNVLNTVQLNLVVNGTTIQTVNAPLNLPFMRDTLYAFTTTFNPRLGSNDICVFTANPNGQPDGFPLDDTACTEAIGFPVISNFPYCNDFDSNLPEWLTRNPYTLRNAGNSWQLGTPNKGFINGTASGPNAWYIGQDSLYGPYDSSALYTPIFEVASGECYRISFKTKFLEDFWNNDPNAAPLLGDGGTLEYSTDGGANFTNFGRLDTFAFEWYNNSVFSLRDFNSTPNSLGLGWSAKSDSSWTSMRQIFNTTTNTLVLFRFRHGSDDAFHGEGFAVDDFCFEIVPGPCGLVNVEEAEMAGFQLKQNYPNPFAQRTTVEYVLPSHGEVSVHVKDMLGRTIYDKREGLLGEGVHRTELDLARMEAGVYFYTVTFNGMSQTKKMIISK